MEKLTLNKNEFMKSPLGIKIGVTAAAVVEALEMSEKYRNTDLELYSAHKSVARLKLEKLSAYEDALVEFYGIKYAFTRTDEYYGLVNEDDETDFLCKFSLTDCDTK